MNYCDYTTINNLRNVYMASDMPQRDDTLLALIQSTSREIEAMANRSFYPTIQTRKYNAPVHGWGWTFANAPDAIQLDEDLLSITSVTNGDGTALVNGTDYLPYPLNDTPYYELRRTWGGTMWLPNTHGPYGALSVAGVWGYHPDYGSAWADTLATLAANITTTSATTFTATTGKLFAGDLLQVDTEWMYVVSVSTGDSDTATVKRGVNGSTAATHTSGASVLRWYNPIIENVVKTGVVAYYRTRNNPTGDTLQIDGNKFSTPHDVLQWIEDRLRGLGLIRSGIG